MQRRFLGRVFGGGFGEGSWRGELLKHLRKDVEASAREDFLKGLGVSIFRKVRERLFFQGSWKEYCFRGLRGKIFQGYAQWDV